MAYRISYESKPKAYTLIKLQCLICAGIFVFVLFLRSVRPEINDLISFEPDLLEKEFAAGYARGEGLWDLAAAYCAGVLESAGYETEDIC